MSQAGLKLFREMRMASHSHGFYQLCFLRSRVYTIIPSKDLLLINTVHAQPKISNDQKRKKKLLRHQDVSFCSQVDVDAVSVLSS